MTHALNGAWYQVPPNTSPKLLGDFAPENSGHILVETSLTPLAVMFSQQFTCKNSLLNNHIYCIHQIFQKMFVFNYPTQHHSQEQKYHGIWKSISSVLDIFGLAPTHAAFHDDSAHFGGAWPNVPQRRRCQESSL